MKKKLIALLVVAVVTTGLFAFGPGGDPEPGDFIGSPGPSSFDVTTTVEGINLMKITKAAFSGTTKDAFTGAAAYAGELKVTTSGSQTFDAYISTLSNSRIGYKVTMSATPMTSTTGEGQNAVTASIHYTVTANSQSVDTSGKSGGPGAGAKVIINTLTDGLDGVAPASHQISLTVDKDTFDAAVEGEYAGTVTFTWTVS